MLSGLSRTFKARMVTASVIAAALIPMTAVDSVAARGTLAPAATSASDVETTAMPTAAGWIRQMNNILDKSGTFFIADYGDPGYFDWSTDGCSPPAPDDTPYGFKWACRRHDFGVRSLQRGESRYNRDMWNRENKAVVDRQFREDLYTHCRVEHDDSAACRAVANDYHFFASRYNGWDTRGIERYTLTL